MRPDIRPASVDAESTKDGLPLEGVRVLDLSRALSGPFCTMILGDLGADVIKVEPVEGEMTRHWGPYVGDESVYFLSTNRNKRGLALDFRSEFAKKTLTALAANSDVLVENFRPGVAAELGLAYEEVSRKNPRIVCASITGFGSTGPAASWPGFDQIAQGYSGLMSLTGSAATGPIRVGVAIGDLTAGIWTALGVVSAVLRAQKTGRGEKVDTSLLASLVSLLGVQGQQFLCSGTVPTPSGNANPIIFPYGTFRTADGAINVAPATNAMWIALCVVLEASELVDDPRFADNAKRVENRQVLENELTARFVAQPTQTWVSNLVTAGVPAGPIYTLDQAMRDPQVVHSQLVRHVLHPGIGELSQLVSPLRFETLDLGNIRRPPPRLGEHSVEILKDFGLKAREIDQLLEQKAVVQRDK